MNSLVTLNVLPNVAPVPWVDFGRKYGPFSIALDGFVKGGPKFDPRVPCANFNHHEEVDHLATRATCAQVHLAVRQGLFSRFRDASGPRAVVYVNDCDQDVCLSWWLLKNHYRAAPTMCAALNRLVGMEDMLDATAGAYPLPADLPFLRELAWVFEPYARARSSGALDARDSSTHFGIIEDVEGRIDRHLVGNGGSLPLDLRYERFDVLRLQGVAIVREVGHHARTAMFADGIRAFVSVRERADGRWQYVLGRMSQYVPFHLPRAYALLNEAEGLHPFDRWGGGDTIGGSPRIGGSKLEPSAVVEVLKACVGDVGGGGLEKRAS